MLRQIISYVVAVTFMVVAGSATQSVFVQQAWTRAAGEAAGEAPASMSFSDRLAWAAHDVVGLLPRYGELIAVALLIAFLVAGWLARRRRNRTLLFALAGAVALWLTFTAMRLILGTVGVFGVRGPAGLAAQMVIGGLAGMLFAQLTRPSASSTH